MAAKKSRPAHAFAGALFGAVVVAAGISAVTRVTDNPRMYHIERGSIQVARKTHRGAISAFKRALTEWERKPATPARASLAARAARGRVTVSLVLSPSVVALLGEQAAERGESRSAVVEGAIVAYAEGRAESDAGGSRRT